MTPTGHGSSAKARTMLAVVVALGGVGGVLLSSLLLFSPGTRVPPKSDAQPLHSVVVLPAAGADPALAADAAWLAAAIARTLAAGMPHVRVVAPDAAGASSGAIDAAGALARRLDVRFVLTADLREVDGRVEVMLRVIDGRDAREAGRALATFEQGQLRAAGDALASSARRLVMAAMLRSAAE